MNDDSDDIFDNYCMNVALMLTFGIPEPLPYDILLDNDYELDSHISDNDIILDHIDKDEKNSDILCPSRNCANEMHVAVFRYDIDAVETLLRCKEVSHWDHPDHNGNTPLLLATKLGFVNLARLLIAEGFSCDCSSMEGDFEYQLMDEAILTSSLPLVQDVYCALQQISWQQWLDKKDVLMNCMEMIPDFYVELHWNFTGIGPMGGVVKMFAPDDTYRIWKRGTWLRLDSSIAGFNNNFSARRGDLSLVFRGRREGELTRPGEVPFSSLDEGQEGGDLLYIDRSNQTFQRVCVVHMPLQWCCVWYARWCIG